MESILGGAADPVLCAARRSLTTAPEIAAHPFHLQLRAGKESWQHASELLAIGDPSETRDPLASTALRETSLQEPEQPPRIHRGDLRPPAQRLHHLNLLLRRRELEIGEIYPAPQPLLHLQIHLEPTPILFSIPRTRSADTPWIRHHRGAEKE
jgi:hypothetical protein